MKDSTAPRLARTNTEILAKKEFYSAKVGGKKYTVFYDENAFRFRSYDPESNKIGGFVSNQIGQEVYENRGLRGMVKAAARTARKYAALAILSPALMLSTSCSPKQDSTRPAPKVVDGQPFEPVFPTNYSLPSSEQQSESQEKVPNIEKKESPITLPPTSTNATAYLTEAPPATVPIRAQDTSKHYTNVQGLSLPKESEYTWDEQRGMYVTKRSVDERALVAAGKTRREARELTSTNVYFKAHLVKRGPHVFNEQAELYEIPSVRSNNMDDALDPSQRDLIDGIVQYVRNANEIQGRRSPKESFDKAGKEAELAGESFSKIFQPEHMVPKNTAPKAWKALGDFGWNFVQLGYSVINIPNWLPSLNDKSFKEQPGWFRPFMYAGRTIPLATKSATTLTDIPTAGVVGSVVYPFYGGVDHGAEMIKDGLIGIVRSPLQFDDGAQKLFDIPQTAITLGFNVGLGRGYSNMEKANIERMVNDKDYFGVLVELGLGGWLTGTTLEDILEENNPIKTGDAPGRSGGSGVGSGMGRGGGAGVP